MKERPRDAVKRLEAELATERATVRKIADGFEALQAQFAKDTGDSAEIASERDVYLLAFNIAAGRLAEHHNVTSEGLDAFVRGILMDAWGEISGR